TQTIATDLKTDTNETASVATFCEVPGEGLGFFRTDTSLHITPPFFPPIVALTYLFDEGVGGSTDSGSATNEAATFEEAAVEPRQVLLVSVNAKGEESEPVALDESALDDLPGLFRRLPDGRFRIYLKE